MSSFSAGMGLEDASSFTAILRSAFCADVVATEGLRMSSTVLLSSANRIDTSRDVCPATMAKLPSWRAWKLYLSYLYLVILLMIIHTRRCSTSNSDEKVYDQVDKIANMNVTHRSYRE